MAFEEKMNTLSDIVKQLENGDLTLDKTVKLYGKGVKLADECRKELENARLKITDKGEENESAVK